jgi:hypothetical protein
MHAQSARSLYLGLVIIKESAETPIKNTKAIKKRYYDIGTKRTWHRVIVSDSGQTDHLYTFAIQLIGCTA